MMNSDQEKLYSAQIRECQNLSDKIIIGILDVLDSGCLNGKSEEFRSQEFVIHMKNLISNITDLAQKQIPLERAFEVVVMTLGVNRKITAITDRVFEDIVDAAAINLKRTRLISPLMRLRHVLKDTLSVLKNGGYEQCRKT